MCNPTMQPPRRDLYELTQTLTAENQKSAAEPEPTGSFFVSESDRRWIYIGPETHYGYTYYIWENELTHRKYAWEVEKYHQQTTETK